MPRIFNCNLSGFKIMHSLHLYFGLPAMTCRERGIYKKILHMLAKDGPLNIFEYGSGFSTLYFATYLRRKKIPYGFDSVDNNPEWHGRVKEKVYEKKLDQSITLHLRSFKPFWDKEGWDWDAKVECGKFAPQEREEHEYIELPLTLNKKFDLIVIDARFRRRCLEVALKCIKPSGVVLLHDAQREHYHEPTARYQHSYFVDSGHYFPCERRTWKMWVGSHENASLEKIINKNKI